MVAAASARGSDAAAACEGGEWVLDVSGRLTAGTAVEVSAVEALAVEATADEEVDAEAEGNKM